MTSTVLIIFWLLLACIPPLFSRKATIYLTNPTHLKSPQTLAAQSEWQLDLLETQPGVVLPGLVHLASDSQSPWILYLPGNSRNQLASGQNYLKHFTPPNQDEPRWGLAVWGMRGYDNVASKPSASGFRADYLAIYNHLRSTYRVPAANIHLVGFSFGTDLAIQLAADIIQKGETPGSITLLSTQGLTAPTWKMRRKGWYYRWLPADRYDLRQAFAHIRQQILVIEAENDLRNPIDYLNKMLPEKPKYLELPEGNHTSSLNEQSARDAVRRWITGHTPHVLSN